MDTERLAREFIALSLPKPEWTHEAHLRVGLWHALRHPEDEVLALLRGRIRAYNESVGGVNSDTAGYHETITRLYVRLIANFVAGADRRRGIEDLARELIERCGDRKLPLHYYSRERLESSAARLNWLEPDLEPLP